MEEKIIVGEQDVKVDLIDSFPNHPYSCLFAAYCRSQNIPCYVVDGDKRDNLNYHHTWNRVYLGSSWWDVDTTNDATSDSTYGFNILNYLNEADESYYITRIY